MAAGVPEGTDIVNCAGKVVAPGLIDMRAFVGEPGASHRETFASASQAAAAGGITTIICQPDTSPVIDNSATVDFVLRRARDTAIVNIHPMAALTKGLRVEEMTEIGLLKAAGAVAFTDGLASVVNAQVMRRALTYARDFDALIVHHTEDRNLIGEGVMNEGEFAARLGLAGAMVVFSVLFFAVQLAIVLALAPRSPWPWILFGFFANAAIFAYPLLAARLPIAFSGRANTALNFVSFSGAFIGQFAVGWIIDFFPRAAGGGYAAEAYRLAFAILLGLEIAGLAWFLYAYRRFRAAEE